MNTQSVLDDITQGSSVYFFQDLDAYCIVSDAIILYLPTGKIILKISQQIDKVVSVHVVRHPKSASYFIFVFGEKTVSIQGI
jgi:hypothetical protein